METSNAQFIQAWPYQQDKMSLPVASLQDAIPFYESKMGFKLVTSTDLPVKTAILKKDDVEIGLAENGGDPSQDGCFFEVQDIQAAMAELKTNGLDREVGKIGTEKHGETSWQVFYVVAPDGLCFCYGQRI